MFCKHVIFPFALQFRLLRIRVRMWVRSKTFPYCPVRPSTRPTERLGTRLTEGLKKKNLTGSFLTLVGTSSSLRSHVLDRQWGEKGGYPRRQGGRRASCSSWQRGVAAGQRVTRSELLFSMLVHNWELCPGARWEVNHSTRWAAAWKSHTEHSKWELGAMPSHAQGRFQSSSSR